jgi:hypothetical protein
MCPLTPDQIVPSWPEARQPVGLRSIEVEPVRSQAPRICRGGRPDQVSSLGDRPARYPVTLDLRCGWRNLGDAHRNPQGCTARGSMPSTRQEGMPKPSARAERRGSAVLGPYD